MASNAGGDAAWRGFGLRPPAQRVDPPVGPRDVASILDRALAATPDAEALADERRRFDFAALHRAIEGVRGLLARAGVGPGDRVAAALANGCDIVIAFMAVQRSGAVWVGINQVLPPAEMARLLGHAGASLLVTDQPTARALQPCLDAAVPLVVVDGADASAWEAALSGHAAAAPPRPAIDPFAPAAILYTSGTSGLPKGVVHSQHAMVTVCAAAAASGSMRPEGRRGVILPLSIANLMILGPLMAFWNARACVCGRAGGAASLVAWFARERIETCTTVPTIVYDLLQCDLDLPARLALMSGGAPLPASLGDAFQARHGYRITHTYGLTEAPTVVAETRGLVPPSGASGLALPHLEVTIRDAAGHALPPGAIGEVCVAAPADGPWAGVYTPPLGYWKDASQTEQLLRGGVLHTGDLGALDADGWLSIAERSTELILRAGSNIYPAEIETVLHRHAGVAGCAVVGLPDARLGMHVVAVIEAATGQDHDALQAGLAALCTASLARYKVPDRWIFVTALPRNAMGKIQKATLRRDLA